MPDGMERQPSEEVTGVINTSESEAKELFEQSLESNEAPEALLEAEKAEQEAKEVPAEKPELPSKAEIMLDKIDDKLRLAREGALEDGGKMSPEERVDRLIEVYNEAKNEIGPLISARERVMEKVALGQPVTNKEMAQTDRELSRAKSAMENAASVLNVGASLWDVGGKLNAIHEVQSDFEQVKADIAEREESIEDMGAELHAVEQKEFPAIADEDEEETTVTSKETPKSSRDTGSAAELFGDDEESAELSEEEKTEARENIEKGLAEVTQEQEEIAARLDAVPELPENEDDQLEWAVNIGMEQARLADNFDEIVLAQERLETNPKAVDNADELRATLNQLNGRNAVLNGQAQMLLTGGKFPKERKAEVMKIVAERYSPNADTVIKKAA